jgi:hypothetical protein
MMFSPLNGFCSPYGDLLTVKASSHVFSLPDSEYCGGAVTAKSECVVDGDIDILAPGIAKRQVNHRRQVIVQGDGVLLRQNG